MQACEHKPASYERAMHRPSVSAQTVYQCAAAGFAEMMHIRNSLPDEVVVQRIDERLNSLGNCIACNDYVALIHPDIDKVQYQMFADVAPSISACAKSLTAIACLGVCKVRCCNALEAWLQVTCMQ